MPTGYRRYVLAALGCLAVAASPAQPNKREGHQGERNRAGHQVEAATSVVKPAPGASNANRGKAGCEAAGEGNLSCDEVTAKAAVQQARDADWQADAAAFSAVVGLLTLFAAFWAARWAKAAAQHTATGANEARRAADAAEHGLSHSKAVSASELRPWLAIDCKVIDFSADRDCLSFDYEIIVSNVGETVASDFTYRITSTVIGYDKSTEAVEAFFKGKPPKDDAERMALIPGEVYSGRGACIQRMDHIKWAPGPPPRTAMILVIIVAFYRSPFDSDVHRTERSFLIGKKGPTFLQERTIREDIIATDATDIVVSRFISGATT